MGSRSQICPNQLLFTVAAAQQLSSFDSKVFGVGAKISRCLLAALFMGRLCFFITARGDFLALLNWIYHCYNTNHLQGTRQQQQQQQQQQQPTHTQRYDTSAPKFFFSNLAESVATFYCCCRGMNSGFCPIMPVLRIISLEITKTPANRPHCQLPTANRCCGVAACCIYPNHDGRVGRKIANECTGVTSSH